MADTGRRALRLLLARWSVCGIFQANMRPGDKPAGHMTGSTDAVILAPAGSAFHSRKMDGDAA